MRGARVLGSGPHPFTAALLGALGALLGCDGASSDPGLEAWMRIRGAQYVEGSLSEAPGAERPLVSGLSPLFDVARRAPAVSLAGTVSEEATGVLVGLRGDRGHWILRPTGADLVNQFPSSFAGVASFSAETPLGAQVLLARGVARDGTVGPVAQAALSITDAPAATGALVVSLDWDSESDLDLRVIAPDTRGNPIEIWTKRRLSTGKVPPGEPKPDAAEIAMAGELDFDSNAQCVIDGRRQENITWKQAPPVGAYTVRVDAFSLCGEASARWRVRAFLGGALVGQAQGQMTDWDTRGDHAAGAGLTVLSFNL